MPTYFLPFSFFIFYLLDKVKDLFDIFPITQRVMEPSPPLIPPAPIAKASSAPNNNNASTSVITSPTAHHTHREPHRLGAPLETYSPGYIYHGKWY